MIEELQSAGLTSGEARAYVALCELGESTTGPIVEKSGVNRSIIYQILEKLAEKGLVSVFFKDRTKHFQAAPPVQLLEFISSQKSRLDEAKEKINKISPSILLLQKSTPRSHATLYEGFKGIMTAYENRFAKLKAGDEYFNLGLPATQPAHHHAFWQKDHAMRVEKKIKAKLLYNVRVSDDTLKNRNGFWGCDARRMPIDIETPSWILVYRDTVVIAIPQGIQPLAIEIVSQEVADSFKGYFDWFWNKSAPFKRKPALAE